MHFFKESICGGTIVLDGNHYAECWFDRATLVYNGGTVPVFEDCTIDHCDWQLNDAAGRTLQFLQMLNAMDGGGALIEKAFPIIIARR